MRYDLAQLTRRSNPSIRRRAIVIRDIAPPGTLATDLFRACYLPVIEAWQRAAEPIVEEYSRTLGSIATDARSDYEAGDPPPELHARLNDSASDIQARIDAASSDGERLFLQLTAALEDWGIRVERWQRSKWRDVILSATGVDLNTLIGPSDVRATVAQYLEWNAALIRDVSAQIRQKVANSVFAGLTEQKPARQVAKEIREATGFARDRSVRIASDQMSKLSAALADERAHQVGLSVWKWRWSRKKHPREHHKARDGNLYTDDSAMVGREVNGEVVLPPPTESDQPGRPPYCGCRKQFVLVMD